MVPARNNMFLVCVTVGLVFLASKYRNNVLHSVKNLYDNIKIRDNSDKNKNKKSTSDNNKSDANHKEDKSIKSNNNENNNNNKNINYDKKIKILLDKIILADSPEKCDYAVQRIRW